MVHMPEPMILQSVEVTGGSGNSGVYVFAAAVVVMIACLWVVRNRMKRKLRWSIAIGCAASIILFWIPTFWLRSFDEHTAMYMLLLLYCPLIACPFVCFGSWLLHPTNKRERFWIPVIIATSLMLPSIAALTWRDHRVHYVRGWEVAYTFVFLVGWLLTEVLVIAVPLSFAINSIREKLWSSDVTGR